MKTLCLIVVTGLLAAKCTDRRQKSVNTVKVELNDGDTAKSPAGDRQQKPGVSVPINHGFPSQVAGEFYPANPDELKKQIQGFLAASADREELKERDIVGVLAPHAGYRYSGPVAGQAYGALARKKGEYKTVVVLALSHRKASRKAAVLNKPAYDTPLGSAKIDGDVVGELLKKHGDLFEDRTDLFKGEHSLEVQVPFLQVALPKAAIVPIIVAVQDDSTAIRIGHALYSLFGRRKDMAFVVSSDLSHFFPYEDAKKLDNETLKLLESWRIPEWKTAAARHSKGMCGYRPMLVFVSLFEKYGPRSRLVSRLGYKNSGDTAGDPSRVVGYGALAFSLEKTMRTEKSESKDFGPFGAKERRYLLELAKESVRAAVKGVPFRPEKPVEKNLAAKGAAFVTLKKDDQLRGCIGHVIARIPLYECVSDVARSAAIHDTRFSPVRGDELADITYEISVLTAPEPIKPENIVVGTHGLIMSRGSRAGLLLPQVPVEWGWDREEFLAHTCRKAGFSLGCWKDPDTKIEAFRAIVFGEDELDD